ncbi:hypothetical protein POSPLADRAFT_1157770 [Postia placenta MAD-698-R-SB12]|uniref:Uncharacterized protein n=1 Tax=Postia placenta MAD-698-R-SB12 TaxID=670580 RepID=A0A1X6ML87_9APHY|nr:hypothetical protein POSPLADRAFT_1157770 [Postia placenta MAD-698-R-SB12]OSX57078.1 hypothetical protein POSPLADRAFT_1157770 [Postia placenta MAD-698-R-SB12]
MGRGAKYFTAADKTFATKRRKQAHAATPSIKASRRAQNRHAYLHRQHHHDIPPDVLTDAHLPLRSHPLLLKALCNTPLDFNPANATAKQMEAVLRGQAWRTLHDERDRRIRLWNEGRLDELRGLIEQHLADAWEHRQVAHAQWEEAAAEGVDDDNRAQIVTSTRAEFAAKEVFCDLWELTQLTHMPEYYGVFYELACFPSQRVMLVYEGVVIDSVY